MGLPDLVAGVALCLNDSVLTDYLSLEQRSRIGCKRGLSAHGSLIEVKVAKE